MANDQAFTSAGVPYPLKIIQAKSERLCQLCGQPIPAGGEAVRVDGGLAHPSCKARRLSLLSSATLAEKIGLTPAQFLRLAKQLALQPEAYYPNPYSRRGPDVPLWPPELVDELAAHPALVVLKARAQAARQAKERKAEERQVRLAAQYPEWRQALLPAAQAMFSLNRYAKWQRCAPAHRREIYHLKNTFVHLLSERGYAVEVLRHNVPREGLECWNCEGYGCERCNFSGFYRRPDKLVYIAFRFQIEGQFFSWHQPAPLVNWPVTYTTSGAADWLHDPADEKAIELNSRQFADAKALIRYVLDQAGFRAETNGQKPSNPTDKGDRGQRKQKQRVPAPHPGEDGESFEDEDDWGDEGRKSGRAQPSPQKQSVGADLFPCPLCRAEVETAARPAHWGEVHTADHPAVTVSQAAWLLGLTRLAFSQLNLEPDFRDEAQARRWRVTALLEAAGVSDRKHAESLP